MREICMSGSTRERGAAVIDAIVFHSVLSSLLYRPAPTANFGLAQKAQNQNRLERRIRLWAFTTRDYSVEKVARPHPDPLPQERE
jgi:hypothetical protein